MGRSTKQTPAKAKIPEGIPAGHATTLEETKIAGITEAYSEDRDMLNQFIGQIQMAQAFSKFADVVSLSKIKHIKETKQYRALAGKKGRDRDGNEIADVGTFEAFCLAIGTTRQKVDEDLANLNTFGEEALGNLNRIGIGYRDLRQYRKLPADERLALMEAAKDGDKEGLLDLAESLISKHAKEKEVLTKRVEDTEGDLEASRARVAAKETETERLTKELARAKKRVETATPDEEGKQLRDEVHLFAFEAEATILGKLTPGFEALAAHADKNGCTHEEFMAGCLCQIERALIGLRNRFNVKAEPDGDEMPDWARPGADELQARKLAEITAKTAKKNQAR